MTTPRERPPRRSRRRPLITAAALIATAALAASVLWWWNSASPDRAGMPGRTASAVRDSLERAQERADPDAVLRWALELARIEPHRSETQRRLAIAWHNYGALDRTGDSRERPPVRTSLQRIECERRALAAADSARVLADNDQDWIAAMRWTGMAYEFLGLPIDALDALVRAHRRRPGIPQIEGPIQILRRRLESPLETGEQSPRSENGSQNGSQSGSQSGVRNGSQSGSQNGSQ